MSNSTELVILVILLFVMPAFALSIWSLTRAAELDRRLAAVRQRLDRVSETLAAEIRELRQHLSRIQAVPPATPTAVELAVTGETTSPAAPKVDVEPQGPVVSLPLKSQAPIAQAPTSPAPVAPVRISPSAAPRPVPPVVSTRPPAVPAPPAPKPAVEKQRFDWEGLVGVRLFSWIAGIAMLLGAVFFLRYTIDQGWLTPPVRMAIGLAVGIGLLALCEIKAARRYPFTANAMDASGVAILFATLFAAHELWKLIPTVADFALLVLVAAGAVILSIRRDSLFIALLGLLGGFATPALLSTGENRPIPLFGYLLLLNAGLAWVASRKRWPLLTRLSLGFTTLYQWGWVMKFLTTGQLSLAVAIFLAFPLLGFAGLALQQRGSKADGETAAPDDTVIWSAALPLFFAVHLACVPEYGAHYGILFGFLFVLALGFSVIAAVRGPEVLHPSGGLSAVIVFALWLMRGYDVSAWPAILIFVALFVVFYLCAPFVGRWFGRVFTGWGARGVFAAPLLLFTVPALILLEPRCASPGLIFATLFLLLAAAAAYAIFTENGPVYFVGAFFAVISEAVWSYKHLERGSLTNALAIYGLFSLFYLGVPVLARRMKKLLKPESGAAGIMLCSLGLVLFLARGPVAQSALWGIAFLLLLINVGLLMEGSGSRVPALVILGTILSWLILVTLWSNVSLADILVPALAVVAGFSLLAMAGNIWLQMRAAPANLKFVNRSEYLGLAGYLFLYAVALQETLAVPPWPLLGVLLVLNAAIGAVVLYTRRQELYLPSMIASQVILLVWVPVARISPWPEVAIICAGVVALLSMAWIDLARRVGMGTRGFSTTAAVAVMLAEAVAIVASQQPGSPGLSFLAPAHLAFLAALLALAWISQRQGLAVIAVIPTAVAVSLWMWDHDGAEFWLSQMYFAGTVYVMFLCYPLLLGRRAGTALGPYLAAVLASVPFFFQARHAMIRAGYEGVIGVLPVTQALLLGLLLVRLLRIELPGARQLGRLALVAGAALAFITVAIPLQLENQWITLGWAFEGAALAWLYGKIPHRGLLYTLSGLFGAVFVRLALNPAVFNYVPRGALRIWNWYLYAYLLSAGAMILAGWLLSRTTHDRVGPLRISRFLPAGGAVLLFLLLNIEIADYYSEGPAITFNFSATLAQDLTYTLGWALFAVALLAAGIAVRSQAARISAIALLAVTILKCFIHDLARLGGLYRVFSFVGLALCLALVAVVLQKFVLSARANAK